MRPATTLLAFATVTLLMCGLSSPVEAHIADLSKIPNGMNVKVNGVAHLAVGHTAAAGGGSLNVFGDAYEDADEQWTVALCQADSDGDGQTNGFELGDPNCVWTVGATPTRTTDISHPGDKSSTTAATSPPTPPPTPMPPTPSGTSSTASSKKEHDEESESEYSHENKKYSDKHESESYSHQYSSGATGAPSTSAPAGGTPSPATSATTPSPVVGTPSPAAGTPSPGTPTPASSLTASTPSGSAPISSAGFASMSAAVNNGVAAHVITPALLLCILMVFV